MAREAAILACREAAVAVTIAHTCPQDVTSRYVRMHGVERATTYG
ncbi:hypothetical protein [Streptomyces mirabilis]